MSDFTLLTSSGTTLLFFLRHLIFAPSMFNLYTGSKFPGITDSIYLAEQSHNWEQVKKQVSMVVHAVRSAVTVLTPVDM